MEKIPALFKLKIRGIGLGTHQVDLKQPAGQLDLPMFHGNIHAKGELIVGNRLELHLHLAATGTFICDRCAIEFEKTLTPDLDLLYLPPDLSKDIEEDDNIHVYDPLSTNEIDFTEDLRDAVLLAIPMKNLHSPDCKGVDLGGSEVVIDERLAGLGSLLEQLREEEMNSEAQGGVFTGLILRNVIRYAKSNSSQLTDAPRQTPHPL
ncbi:MAG: YceD family protein [Candidatus Kapaibacterium sp.]